jgi:hypothetical protein
MVVIGRCRWHSRSSLLPPRAQRARATSGREAVGRTSCASPAAPTYPTRLTIPHTFQNRHPKEDPRLPITARPRQLQQPLSKGAARIPAPKALSGASTGWAARTNSVAASIISARSQSLSRRGYIESRRLLVDDTQSQQEVSGSPEKQVHNNHHRNVSGLFVDKRDSKENRREREH